MRTGPPCLLSKSFCVMKAKNTPTALALMVYLTSIAFPIGSPKLPALLEAVAVHYIDNLDAKLNMYLTKINNDNDPASDWTEYVRSLDVKIFKRDVMGIRKPAGGSEK